MQVCGTTPTDEMYEVVRTLDVAMEAQRASVGIAALALNYVLRSDLKGKLWLAAVVAGRVCIPVQPPSLEQAAAAAPTCCAR